MALFPELLPPAGAASLLAITLAGRYSGRESLPAFLLLSWSILPFISRFLPGPASSITATAFYYLALPLSMIIFFRLLSINKNHGRMAAAGILSFTAAAGVLTAVLLPGKYVVSTGGASISILTHSSWPALICTLLALLLPAVLVFILPSSVKHPRIFWTGIPLAGVAFWCLTAYIWGGEPYSAFPGIMLVLYALMDPEYLKKNLPPLNTEQNAAQAIQADTRPLKTESPARDLLAGIKTRLHNLSDHYPRAQGEGPYAAWENLIREAAGMADSESQSTRNAVDEIMRQVVSLESAIADVRLLEEKSRLIFDNGVGVSRNIDMLTKGIRAGKDLIQTNQEAMKKIMGHVGSIMGVLEFLENIAEETHMLAINASIEAAHSGSEGLGFSVIAEEIRQVAIVTKTAAVQISAEVNNIKDLSHRREDSISSIESIYSSFSSNIERFFIFILNILQNTKELKSDSETLGQTMEQMMSVALDNDNEMRSRNQFFHQLWEKLDRIRLSVTDRKKNLQITRERLDEAARILQSLSQIFRIMEGFCYAADKTGPSRTAPDHM